MIITWVCIFKIELLDFHMFARFIVGVWEMLSFGSALTRICWAFFLNGFCFNFFNSRFTGSTLKTYFKASIIMTNKKTPMMNTLEIESIDLLTIRWITIPMATISHSDDQKNACPHIHQHNLVIRSDIYLRLNLLYFHNNLYSCHYEYQSIQVVINSWILALLIHYKHLKMKRITLFWFDWVCRYSNKYLTISTVDTLFA